ncbi:hypothetical protein SGLAM104S_07857 [Streptomyces glaucescens]
MPWSLKASGLLRSQYAAVGAASGAVFPGVLAALEGAAARGAAGLGGLLDRQRERAADAAAFTAAYRRYCWTTEGLDGVRLAPFQILAVRGRSLAGLPTTNSWPCWTGSSSTTAPGCCRPRDGCTSTPRTPSPRGPASTGGWR